MPNTPRDFTHAIFAALPEKLKHDDKKHKLNRELLRAQIDGFQETLRQTGCLISEINLPEGSTTSSLLLGDLAIVIGELALLCRPPKLKEFPAELQAALKLCIWKVTECPAVSKGKKIVLDGADVLYTGKEIFVGVRSKGTNIEGAGVVARVFSSIPVLIIPLNNNLPLRHYFSVVLPGKVLSVSNNEESQEILDKIQKESTFRYKVLTTADDPTTACLNVNGSVIVRQDKPEPKFTYLKSDNVDLWAIDASEISKLAQPFHRLCVLLKRRDLPDADHPTALNTIHE